MAWGVGAPKIAMQKEANHSLFLFDGAYKKNHGVATAEKYHKHPATPY